MMKQTRLISGFIAAALAGGLLGILVQAAQSRGYYLSLPAAFATVSCGLFFWITVCTAISYRSRCGLHAALLVLCLLIPVLWGYVLTAGYLGCRLNSAVVGFGLLMLLPSALAAWILRAYRDRRGMRMFVRIAGIAALLFDIGTRGDFGMRAVALSLLLMMFFLHTVNRFEPRRGDAAVIQ